MHKILIHTKEITFVLRSEDILYCQAAGAYSIIYLVSGQEIVTSFNLLNLYERMKCFTLIFRISQSFLVNMQYVQCIHHLTKELELRNSKLLRYTVSIRELEHALLGIFTGPVKE
jgi:DNA-binding LytR/AlgR family response regulator